jgi:O-acetyl-ADP-ribose deacetylase (regulator of RNase III)
MSGGGVPWLTEGRVITRAVEDFRETRGLGEVVVVVVEEEEEEEEMGDSDIVE